MFTVQLADIKICIDNKYNYIKNMCAEYITESGNEDVFISVTDDEIQAEATIGFQKDYFESLAVYRKIADLMPDYNGFLMHGVLLKYKHKGVLICAKSGVGKSTHASLWQQLLGEKCQIINGDKPLVRFKENTFLGYGTPWSGKEQFNINASVPITDVCFLERAVDNSVKKMSDNLLVSLLSQIYLPQKTDKLLRTTDLIQNFIVNTKQWKIRCNMDISAALIAYKALFKE